MIAAVTARLPIRQALALLVFLAGFPAAAQEAASGTAAEATAPLSGSLSGRPGPAAMRALVEDLEAETDRLERLRRVREALDGVNRARAERGVAPLRLPCALCLASPLAELCPELVTMFDCAAEPGTAEPGTAQPGDAGVGETGAGPEGEVEWIR